jgi:hypothetical protein
MVPSGVRDRFLSLLRLLAQYLADEAGGVLSVTTELGQVTRTLVPGEEYAEVPTQPVDRCH